MNINCTIRMIYKVDLIRVIQIIAIILCDNASDIFFNEKSNCQYQNYRLN